MKKTRTRYPSETRVRAFAIFKESGGRATPLAISKQLKIEGFGDIPRENISGWKNTQNWKEKELSHKTLALPENEELRQATVIRTDHDLECVERATQSLVRVSQRVAEHVLANIGNLKMETMEDLALAVRGMCELTQMHFAVAKGAQDLRLLRASTNFTEPNGAKNGDIIPPEKPAREPVSEQDRIISNFELN